MWFFNIVEKLVGLAWGLPLIIMIMGAGLYFTLGSGLFQLQLGEVGRVVKKRFFSPAAKEEQGTISPFQAIAIAVGNTVGVGNIGGVATAIAVGGPGAVFWMWVAGICGQILKMVEVTLAVHYRTVDSHDETYGGPAYYIEKGIGEELGFPKFARFLAVLFVLCFFTFGFIGLQNYTISEALSSTFHIPMLTASCIYIGLVYLFIIGGIKGLGKIAALVVPFMCVFYLGGALIVLLKDPAAIPAGIGLIFENAFTGTAAVGGFAGAAFAKAIRMGTARAVYSNEAGWGSAAMIHASSRVDHPVSQGILGIFEVIVDTMIICTATALMIVCSGEWSSGVKGASLTLQAFSHGMGDVGTIILTLGIFIFGLTSTTGSYVMYVSMVRYLFDGHPKVIAKAQKILKFIFPLPSFFLVLYALGNGLPTEKVWLFADLAIALPIFINVFAILVLSPKFFALVKDYKARYMNKGDVDSKFPVYYKAKN